jgi:hypothetical protein
VVGNHEQVVFTDELVFSILLEHLGADTPWLVRRIGPVIEISVMDEWNHRSRVYVIEHSPDRVTFGMKDHQLQEADDVVDALANIAVIARDQLQAWEKEACEKESRAR